MWVAWLAVVAPTVAGVLGGLAWWLDLGNHLVPHALLLGLVGAAVAAARRHRVQAAAFVLAALPCGLRLIPDGAGARGEGEPVRVMVANVLASNEDTRALLDAIDAEDPDVVALLEVTPAWAHALGPLHAAYPFAHVEPRSDCFGLAVYSRVPLQDVDVVWLGGAATPSLVATLPGETALVVTHTLPPISATYAATRDSQLLALAERLDGHQRYVVVGDLNATPWSSAFPDLPVVWTPGTWPSWLPAPLRIPIDHALVSGVAEVGRHAGPDVGSDHLPLVVDVRLP